MKLAAFVRARDLTCRAPGCDRPATQCDLDHTIAFADGGATHAANLKCLCRLHHLLATFCGWRAQQLPDGTVIWTLPGNQTYVTTPGSALLFPALCTPTVTARTRAGPRRPPRQRTAVAAPAVPAPVTAMLTAGHTDPAATAGSSQRSTRRRNHRGRKHNR